MSNQPPFDITPAILNTVELIGELLGRMDAVKYSQNLSVRRVNRIQTLQGTLAIEGNTLPFEDGNGRIGRLWQTLILSRWNPIFATIPVESMIHAHQQEYYQAIIQSSEDARSTAFIQWMLNIILQTLQTSATPQVSLQVTPQVKRLLKMLDKPLSRQQIMAKLKLRDRKSLTQRYLKPALEAGLIQMTRSDQPNSRLQQYQITLLGQQSRESEA